MKHRLDRLPSGPDKGNLRLRIELTGVYEIFRFLVNMLDDQVEFCHAATLKLTALRKQIGPDRFDPYARQMLGLYRYNRLCSSWGGRPAKPAVETVQPTGGAL